MKHAVVCSFAFAAALTAGSLLVLPEARAQDALPAPAPLPAPAVSAAPVPSVDVVVAPAVPAVPAYTYTVSGQGAGAPGADLTYTFQYDGYDGRDAEREIDDLKDQISALKEQLKSVDASDSNGTKNLESRKKQLAELIAQLQRLTARSTVLAPLQKKVDVKFDNATVAQAADALNRASGVLISADPAIPDSTRLSVEARHVRLATVLESIARQASLIIEPGEGFDPNANTDVSAPPAPGEPPATPNGPLSIVLSAPPVLRVNDFTQKFSSSPSPWSDKWGTPPTRRIFLDGIPSIARYFNDSTLGQTMAIAKMGDGLRIEANRSAQDAMRQAQAVERNAQSIERNAMLEMRSAMKSRNAIVLSQDGRTISITTAKDGTVTVTEPGKNRKGESGTWTTVYTVEDGEMKKQSRDFKKD